MKALEKKDFAGIEMETSAVFTVARKFGINAAAAHFVSDLPAKYSFVDKESESEKKMIEDAKAALRERMVSCFGESH
jgi:purine-nucleoside phosphorylase